MSIFIDTSALHAILTADDLNHQRAGQFFNQLLDGPDSLVCTNYVVLETMALLQRRLGIAAVRTFLHDVVPILQVEWVSPQQHADAVMVLLGANRRLLSMVDCVSFVVMREQNITRAFVFDEHFEQQGFTCLP